MHMHCTKASTLILTRGRDSADEGKNAAEWLIITQASLAANNSSLS